MTLDDFIAMMAQAVREQWIDEPTALALVVRFQAGLLDQSVFALPQGLALDIPATYPQAMATFFSGQNRDVAQDYFGIVAEQAAAESSVQVWQEALKFLVIGHIAYQAALALKRPLTKAEWANLRSTALKQLVYLSRFAEQRMVLELIEQPMSQAQVIQRSALYSGSGRAVSFQFGERLLSDGYVVDYQAKDDARTCDPCIGAEMGGPYLPGDMSSPYPGDICLGRGLCRCLRVSRYAPKEAARLGGGAR